MDVLLSGKNEVCESRVERDCPAFIFTFLGIPVVIERMYLNMGILPVISIQNKN